eukprot:TRINITY_DN2959_c0_g1_i3.p1 TRINITY_DN2959_c0_g1~~TRINITY_DN2959_c0_g1_i3.p1  ORF type:complete len:860 (+),score=334.69 TRINITY_DN2959_c0_g1_i3:58-2637(+)
MSESSLIKEGRLKVKDGDVNQWKSFNVIVQGSILSLREEYDRNKVLGEIDLKGAKMGGSDFTDPSQPSFYVILSSGKSQFFASSSSYLQDLWKATISFICDQSSREIPSNSEPAPSETPILIEKSDPVSENAIENKEEIKSSEENHSKEEKKEEEKPIVEQSNVVNETKKVEEAAEVKEAVEIPSVVISSESSSNSISQDLKPKEENKVEGVKENTSKTSLSSSKSASNTGNSLETGERKTTSRKSSAVFDKGLKSSEAALVFWDKVLPGEVIRFYRNVIRIGVKEDKEMESNDGTLYVTNFRLCFFDGRRSDKMAFCIPLTTIKEVRKIKKTKVQVSTIVNYKAFEIVSKDLRRIILVYGKNQQVNANIVQDIIEAIPKNQQQLFAFSFPAFSDSLPQNFNGWEVYNVVQDYVRLGIPDFKWRISNVNEDLKMSNTYPPLLVVPNRVTDEELLKVAEFRSRGRIPTCVWKHAKSETVLMRCSQPGSGIRSKRCHEDEQLLMAVTTDTPLHELVKSSSTEKRRQSKVELPPNEESNKTERPTRLRNESKSISFRKSTHKSVTLTPLGGKLLYISDSRPKVNAQFNILKGFGWESPDAYKNTILEFWNIENIHVMRDSLKKLGKACRGTLNEADVEKSGWLDHLKKVLVCSVRLAELLNEEDTSVLAHCTDGWDRTAQNVALTELLLDPYYRTIFGFASLIEKEFLSFGHQMATRMGHDKENIYSPKDKERAPIFVQFIDCVWQIVYQTPEEFQFDSKLLIAILDNSFACLYGTFLCDSQAQRDELKLRESTVSFWDFVARNFSFFLNPNYKAPSSNVFPIPIYEKFHPVKIGLWKEYYLRWNNGSSGGEYFPHDLNLTT